MTLLDSGPWETPIANLTAALTTPPPVSKYASEAVKLASKDPLVPASHFIPTFTQQDALTLDKTQLTSLLGTSPLLITILFTLNELFTASGIGKTTAFLLNLTAAVPAGSLLLVVDSPGSYSETSVGKEAKRYPMQWLLDRIMLGTQREPVSGRSWAKVESQDSAWFRLASDALEYPIPLENMRYQMHLYRAEDASLVRDD
jgi:25S rRNA (uracil2843-N3)-methyltransferase